MVGALSNRSAMVEGAPWGAYVVVAAEDAWSNEDSQTERSVVSGTAVSRLTTNQLA